MSHEICERKDMVLAIECQENKLQYVFKDSDGGDFGEKKKTNKNYVAWGYYCMHPSYMNR